MGFVNDRRKKLGLTWEELARLTDLAKQTLYNADQGRETKDETQKKIEKALRVAPGWFAEQRATQSNLITIVPDGPEPALYTTRERQLWRALREIDFSHDERIMHLNFYRVTHPQELRHSAQREGLPPAQRQGQMGEDPGDTGTAG